MLQCMCWTDPIARCIIFVVHASQYPSRCGTYLANRLIWHFYGRDKNVALFALYISSFNESIKFIREINEVDQVLMHRTSPNETRLTSCNIDQTSSLSINLSMLNTAANQTLALPQRRLQRSTFRRPIDVRTHVKCVPRSFVLVNNNN